MGRNEYLLCLKALGDVEIVGAVAQEYIGQQVKIAEKEIARKVIAYFVIYDGLQLTQDEQTKLQQLCRLKANEAAIKISLRRLDEMTLKAKEEEESGKHSSSSNRSFRPDTIRVKNVPYHFDKQGLELELQKLFKVPRATVHSLASFSSRSQCATATFPESTNEDIHNILTDERLRNNVEELHFDEDFLYLTPLYDAGNAALIDIIIVPGLGTHQFGTFRALEGEKMWLRDFLPGDIMEGCSRILLYGYDSVVNDSTTNQNIYDIASTCLNTLHNFRHSTKTTTRPILFLGQCLGGLIIQQLLSRSSRSTDEKEIFDMWGGFIGLGVPINGLDHKELIERAEGKPNEAMMRDICVDRHGKVTWPLRQLADAFETCTKAKDAKIKYFGESAVSSPRLIPGTVPKPDRMMVTPQSNWIILNTTHSMLVKFREGDPHYGIVRDNIQDMAEKIVEKETIKLQKEDADNAASSSKTSSRPRPGKGKAVRRQKSRDMFADWKS